MPHTSSFSVSYKILPSGASATCLFQCLSSESTMYLGISTNSSAMGAESLEKKGEHLHSENAADSSQPNYYYTEGMKERQISVDPVSLKPLMKTVEGNNLLSVPVPSTKPKLISYSLPGSATSSPLTPRALMKNLKKWRNQHPPVPTSSLTRQRSATMSNLHLTEDRHFRRSKSCGEGRSCPPSDEFDLVLKKINHVHEDNMDDLVHDLGWEHMTSENKKSNSHAQEFKCGACLFLPNFSNKVKQVKPKKEQREQEGSVLSRTVSLEKFECGSWASLPAISDNVNENVSLYFDLPVELIRSGANEMQSPVTAAFVFDSGRKGGMKKNDSRRSHGSSARHVRFSDTPPTSYPSSPTSFCISPRLRKAREEFNAYLEEAQRA